MHRGAMAALLLLASASPLRAQTQHGPFIPLGSRLDGLVAWVIDDGGLRAVDPLTRPYRLGAVRSAAEQQDMLPMNDAARRVFEWLQAELEAADDSIAVFAEAGAGAWRNGRRDSFREGGSSGAGPSGGIWAHVIRGPLAVVFNPALDNRLKDDPEFTGKVDRAVAGRLQTGYVALIADVGDLMIGRMRRQWGPALFDGFQVSPSAYAEDQIAGTLRAGPLSLYSIAQRLDDFPPDSTSPAVAVTRWFFAHRLTLKVGDRAWLALTETGVYGGPGRGFEPAFLSPVNPAMLAQFNEDKEVNVLWGAELQARLGRGLILSAAGLLDDIQVDDSTIKDRRPTSGGFTIEMRAPVPGIPVHASVGYTRVLSLTYRNASAPYSGYTLAGIGLGRNFSDYDQVMLRLSARPAATLRATFDAGYLRQGSYDFRQPFPPDSVLAGPGQGFLVRPVRRAAGVRVSAAWEPRAGLSISGEIGANGNASGKREAIASIAVRLGVDVLRVRFGGAWPGIERGAVRQWP